ncbi:MAG: adenosylcobinamide-GDP ribazoletransferase, partial [Bacteroidota bacterium]
MPHFIRHEITIFFTALMFYTRIPCPRWVTHKEAYLNEATRYFPLMGWLVGGVCAAVLYGSHFVFPPSIGVLLALIQGVFLTGAFHEDGFADVCDGFGGGWTKAKILAIMKDSRLGTYGAAGLFFLLACKWALLYEITQMSLSVALLSLWAGHSTSRFIAATFMYTHQYSREDAQSKVKPVAKQLSVGNLLIAGFWGLLPLAFFFNPFVWGLLLPLYLLKIY